MAGHSLPRALAQRHLYSVRATGVRLSSGSDEIAELEARLAELKAKEAAKEADDVREEGAAEEQSASDIDVTELDDFDFATLSKRKKVAAVKTAAPSEFLSESWKEQDQEVAAGAGVGVGQIVGVVALVFALIAFSQVPIGESNIDQATYGGVTPPPPTAAEIRAVYEGITE